MGTLQLLLFEGKLPLIRQLMTSRKSIAGTEQLRVSVPTHEGVWCSPTSMDIKSDKLSLRSKPNVPGCCQALGMLSSSRDVY